MKETSAFISTLLHSGTVTHFMHLSSDSYAKHMALATYYAEIIELVDQFAEAYMGRYQQIKEFQSDFHTFTDPVKYMEAMKGFVTESRALIPQDTELQNIVDSIADLINSTLFKLRYLK